MSAHTQQVSAAFMAPGPVQAAMSAARAGVELTTRFIVGEPEKLQGASPLFTQLGSEVGQLAQQAQSSASSIASWEGKARDAFNSKVDHVAQQLEQLQPVFAQVTATLNQAAQASIQAGQSIAQAVRAVVQAVTAAYEAAKAAAIKTLGASLAKWLTWALGQAAQLVQQVTQIAHQVSSFLNQLGQAIQKAAQITGKIAKGLADLCKKLGLPEKLDNVVKKVLGTFTGEGKIDDLREFGDKKASTGLGELFDAITGDKKDDSTWKDKLKDSLNIKKDLLSGNKNFGEYHEKSGDGKHEFDNGVDASGKFKGEAGDLMAKGKIFADKKGIGVEGSVFSGIRGSAEGSLSFGDGLASATAKGEASLGVGADGEANIGRSGAEAKVDAFAGAKAEGSVTGEVAGFGATGKGEAWAGLGAELEGKAKWDDGKLTIGVGAGAALGVGGKVGVEFTIEPAKTYEAIKGAGSAVIDYFRGE